LSSQNDFKNINPVTNIVVTFTQNQNRSITRLCVIRPPIPAAAKANIEQTANTTCVQIGAS
jgi:hypothetical protein